MQYYPVLKGRDDIEEGLEQYHFVITAIQKGVTILSSQCLELKSLKLSETCILNGNGYST